MSDWLIDLLSGCLAVWLMERLTNLPARWLAVWLMERLTNLPARWLAVWLREKLTDWLDWLTNRLASLLNGLQAYCNELAYWLLAGGLTD